MQDFMHLNEYIDYDISLSATFICRGVETYSHTAGGAGRGGGGGVYIADMKLLSPGLRSPRPPNLHTITLGS